MTANVDYAMHVVQGTGNYGRIPDWRPGSPLHQWARSKGMSHPRQVFGIAKKIAAFGTVGEAGNITGNTPYDGKPQHWLTEALKEARR